MDESRRNGDDDSNGDDRNAVMDSMQQSHSTASATCVSAVASGAVLELISSYTLTTLRLKQDKWHKVMATPEHLMVLLDWVTNSQRRLLVMTLNSAGILIPKSSINDLCQNYSTQWSRKATTTLNQASVSEDIQRTGSFGLSAKASTSTLSNTTTAAATVAASVAMTPVGGPVMMVPLPPPSSSFSTLDGVPRGKCAFFLRRHLNVPLTIETFRTQIICGDFPVHSKIDTLLILLDEIIQPLLENPLNRAPWPQLVRKDLSNRMKDVRNTLTEIKGKTNNRTILSLLVSPTVIEDVASRTETGNNEVLLDDKLRGLLEEMVINWTTQVHEIINEKSACVPSAQKNRGPWRINAVSIPTQEVNFWINRQRNLENMYTQLKSKPHQCVALLLEAIDSPYHRPFATMLKSVVCAWHEAQDVSLWLQPLLRPTAAFNAVSFVNAQDLIAPLVHIVHLIWSNSRYYRSTSRMTVLLRCICNLMIRRANDDLEMETLFQTDADEGLAKISGTIAILEMFKSKLLYYKSKYGSNQTILPALAVASSTSVTTVGEPASMQSLQMHQLWRFSHDDVFGYALDGYLAQLAEVRTIFQAAVSFQSLDKLEIGGCVGKLLTLRTRQIHAEFMLLFEDWTKVEIDVSYTHSSSSTEPRRSSWDTFKCAQTRFFGHLQVLEKKLATILVQAFRDCHNWEQLSKLTTMFANIVQRPTIRCELAVIVAHILSVYERELKLIERIVSEVILAFEYRGIDAIPTERTSFPPTAGAMAWLENHISKCDVFTAFELNALVQVLIVDNPLSPQYEKLTARRNILTTKLSNLQLKIWHNWQQTIEKRIAKGLDSNVMLLLLHTSHRGNGNGPYHRRGGISAINGAALFVACANTANTQSPHPPHCHVVNTAGLSESSPVADTKILEINFSVELFTLLRETKYLLALHQLHCGQSPGDSTANSPYRHLPQTLVDLYAQRDVYWQRKIRLMQLAEYYNAIRSGWSATIEMQLIHPAVNAIEEHLASAVDGLTWRHYDENIIDVIYRRTETLYRHLDVARANVQRILDSIRRWSHEPLHQRSIYGKNLLEMGHQQQRLRTRLLQCDETKSLLHRLLVQNFCLFFNYDEQSYLTSAREQNIQEFLSNFPAEQQSKFHKYLEFIDHLINDLVRQAMKISLEYLLNEMTATAPAETTAQACEVGPARTIKSIQTPTATVAATAMTTAESTVLTANKTAATSKHFLPHLLEAAQTHYPQVSETQAMAPTAKAAVCFTDHLMGPTPPTPTAKAPLFEVHLQLRGAKINFEPTFESNAANNFQQIVEELLADIKLACDSIPRVFHESQAGTNQGTAKGTPTTVACRTRSDDDDSEMQGLHASIQSLVAGTIEAAKAFALQFEVYAPLWTEKHSGVLNRQLRDSEHRLANDEGKFQAHKGFHVMETFKRETELYMDMHNDIEQFDDFKSINSWLLIDIRPLKYSLLNLTCRWSHYYKRGLLLYVERTMQKFTDFIKRGLELLQLPVGRNDFSTLLRVLEVIARIKLKEVYADNLFKPLKEIVLLLKTYHMQFNSQFARSIDQLPLQWQHLKAIAATKMESLQETKRFQQHRVSAISHLFVCHWHSFAKQFQQMPFFATPCSNVYELCDDVCLKIQRFSIYHNRISYCAQLLEIAPPEDKTLHACAAELKRVKQLWDFVHVIESCIIEWHSSPWLLIDTDDIENECKQFARDLRTLDKSIREWAPYLYIANILKELVASLRTTTELQNSAITERHWRELMQETQLTKRFQLDNLMSFKTTDTNTLDDLMKLELHKYDEEIKNTVDRAIKEMSVTKTLDDIKATWSNIKFDIDVHQRRNDIKLLRVSEGLIETLDDNQMQIQNIATTKHVNYLLDKLNHWQHVLSGVEIFIANWFEVQRKWMYLECIFIGSSDIRAQLPQDSRYFENIDREFIELLKGVAKVRVATEIVLNHKYVFEALEQLQQQLVVSEKALNNYLETKRLAFPRFYFISAADLLDILSNGNSPQIIDRHFIKLFDSILRLSFESHSNRALGMHSKENDEFVLFVGSEGISCHGRVEVWLQDLIREMRNTLHELFNLALLAYTEKPRDKWLTDWPAQVSLCCSQICWTADVNRAFAWLEEGYEPAMKDLHKGQVIQLNALISLLLGELTPGDRQKIMTVCTIDVHSRDVVARIIHARVDTALAFQWQSQLRHRWSEPPRSESLQEDCFANICDAEFRYAYEYLGNTSRLVITPLTDRCYITLTQSLHLVMGGAPAGPAGTGKTETTKDLGRALGVMVYVFNCSEQMDYKSCGNIYKGLAQTGAWGCFDEFNRISVEVLSVVAVQVKTIQEAVKMQRPQFIFMGEQIALVPSVGIFITMNPGYAGRTELPENLKSLFRPCAMIVPDFALICEIMLMAEGFQDARLLARKFITLYTLCKELLSQQDHYDWGLRAIKSVLVVAGSLKRDDHSRPEDQVLMRALRDFNIPKIVTEDISIFMGLIGDLFPALDVPRKRVFDFEKIIRRAVNDLKLQPEENFLMKVVQLQELLDVRHSVFIVGNAGTGKTQVWQTLRETYRLQKRKPVCNIMNPKALTNDELFGTVNATTREWKDGLFSHVMREQSNLTNENPKWIVLDGDIDPMWIESLNTLMDDNKILTLANNERISLKKQMRLLFEVGHLKAATPATVSRAGILYINPLDLGWSPYVLSWLETRSDMVERGILTSLFEKYFPRLLQRHRNFRHTVPISDMALIQMSCNLLECLLDISVEPDSTQKLVSTSSHSLHHEGTIPDSLELSFEQVFVYAIMWSFGSSLLQDHTIDWRREFHKWWVSEFKDVKLPSQGSIFDYQLNVKTQKFVRWIDMANQKPSLLLEPQAPIQSVLIPTFDTIRLSHFLEMLMNRNLPCMLVGTSGSGKNSIFRELFAKFTQSSKISDNKSHVVLSTSVQTMQFNYYTSSEIFQKILDRPLEKKSGRTYAPAGAKRRLIYFINDLNMPEVDAYGTVQPHTIMRQFMDYSQWYDRQCLQLKNIRNCQFVACMNPTAGSFTIDPRLQRHFCVFSVGPPSEATLEYIFGRILGSHLDCPQNNFSKEIKSIGQLLVKVGIALHRRMESSFLPTAVKFHYMFNMRDLAQIYQGLMNSCGPPTPGYGVGAAVNSGGTICNKPADLIRLYVHEAYRTYNDRLVDPYDIKSFNSSIRDIFKKDFEDFDEEFVFSDPLIYCHFAQSLADQKYMPLKSWHSLYQLLMEAQSNYNEVIGYMNLVLFEDAMKHVCRINRILESPRNSALLVGVGGSGKQTLARLASFISSFNVYRMQIKRGFGLQDMKEDIAALCMKVGLKNVASVFLLSDAQIPDESHIMLLNDLLAAGEIPELFADDQIDVIINGIRNEVKQSGTLDTKDNCWRYFVEKVRRLLRLILCFSPVGQTLRVRARKFPAILTHTTIDWFHEWPKSALQSVSHQFLGEIDVHVLPHHLIEPIAGFMAYVHGTVNQVSKIYLQNEKRFNYTTPKTFLEYIFLYRKLLVDRSAEDGRRIQRLQSGMAKLAECARQVDTLKDQLAVQEIQLNAKNNAADKLIVIVSAENEKVKYEKHVASEEEKRVRIIEEDVCIKTKMCEEDLRKAEPALVAAQAALNTLNKNNLTELKSFGSPPKAVVNVCAAVMVLFAVNGKIPRDRSWKAAKLMMVRVDQFLSDLVNYNKDDIHPNIIEVLHDYLKDPEFKPDKIVQKSVAAAGLCAWVINIHRYHQVYLIVGPKQQALKDSQNELTAARERLKYLKHKIEDLEHKLSAIQSEFEEAVASKQQCQREADKTTFTIDLAHRLINGLANENIRWRESVQRWRTICLRFTGFLNFVKNPFPFSFIGNEGVYLCSRYR